MLHNKTKWSMLSRAGDKMGLPSEKCRRLGRKENILHMHPLTHDRHLEWLIGEFKTDR